MSCVFSFFLLFIFVHSVKWNFQIYILSTFSLAYSAFFFSLEYQRNNIAAFFFPYQIIIITIIILYCSFEWKIYEEHCHHCLEVCLKYSVSLDTTLDNPIFYWMMFVGLCWIYVFFLYSFWTTRKHGEKKCLKIIIYLSNILSNKLLFNKSTFSE